MSTLKAPNKHQINLLVKNVSKHASASLSASEILELKDLRNSLDDITWSHWLSFARSEKHRRKNKKKEKEKKEEERRLKKEAKKAAEGGGRFKVTTTLPFVPSEDISSMKAKTLQREAEREAEIEARREFEMKIGVLEEALAMSMEEIKERDEKHKVELDEARKAAEDALTELSAIKTSLTAAGGTDGEKGGNYSPLYLDEFPPTPPHPPPSPQVKRTKKPASWKMASIRAALLRLRSAEIAADAASASASAMASFVDRLAPPDVQRAPGMQQVLTALMTAADAQQQFTSAAGTAGELIEPLIEGFEEANVEELLCESWEEWESANEPAVVEPTDDGEGVICFFGSSSSSSDSSSHNSDGGNRSGSESLLGFDSEGDNEEGKEKSTRMKKAKKKKGTVKMKKGMKKIKKKGAEGKKTSKSPKLRKKKTKKGSKKGVEKNTDPDASDSEEAPPAFEFHPPLAEMHERLSELKLQHGSLRSSVESCFAGIGKDLDTLNRTFAGVMCRVMDEEMEFAASGLNDKRRRTPSGRGSPRRDSPSRKVVREQRERRERKAEPGTVRVCAHVRLASEGQVIEGQTPSYGSGNLKISGSSLELGILGGGDLDILRVRYSRVFAYHGGGSEVEFFFNRNIVGEVRPAVVRAVRGEGVGTVTVITAEAGGGDGSRTLLEGEEGDTGLMWEVVKTVFEEIDYNDVKHHGENSTNNRGFFESLRVNVEAVEVGCGRVRDLLSEGGAKARRDSKVETEEDDKECKRRIRVNIRSAEDFNKLLGCITAARSQTQNSHSHMVIRLSLETGVDGSDERGKWAELVFVDMRVPRVDEQVIYGEDWEDDDGEGVTYECEGRYIDKFSEGKRKGGPGMVRERRIVNKKGHLDLLYAQEDVAAIGNILEGRARMREEKKEGGEFSCLLETSRLACEIGAGLEGDGEVRFFAQVKAERYDSLEVRDTASVMLMSSIAMGEGM